MTIQSFIEKAIKGGWRKEHNPKQDGLTVGFPTAPGFSGYFSVYWQAHAILLDPEAWKAVGKVEGWATVESSYYDDGATCDMWLHEMHRLIDTLATGGTIESYLETL